MPLVTNSAALAAKAYLWQGVKYVALDTEFTRERTYYPEFCLLQLATEKGAIVIDVMAPGLDLSPIWELCQDPNILKIFHSGSQDIEILWRASGKMPAPLFDTQIAGMVAGFGESIAYSELVLRLLGVTLDKTHQYQDWAIRPLSDTEIVYALGDVTHLLQAYHLLAAKLGELGRSDWIAEEMLTLSKLPNYPPAISQLWKRFKNQHFSQSVTLKVKQLIYFRDQCAMEFNVGRKLVLHDRSLLKLAFMREPNLDKIHIGQPYRDKLAAYLADIPPLPVEPSNSYVPASEAVKVRLKNLQAQLREIAAELQVVPRLIASKAELERIAQNPEQQLADKQLQCLQGWRDEVFGSKLAI